jgi:hypothetical protein
MMNVLISGFKKKRCNGKHYKYDHVRKCHDAVLVCAKLGGLHLPRYDAPDTKTQLLLLKKEITKAKSSGQTIE